MPHRQRMNEVGRERPRRRGLEAGQNRSGPSVPTEHDAGDGVTNERRDEDENRRIKQRRHPFGEQDFESPYGAVTTVS